MEKVLQAVAALTDKLQVLNKLSTNIEHIKKIPQNSCWVLFSCADKCGEIPTGDGERSGQRRGRLRGARGGAAAGSGGGGGARAGGHSGGRGDAPDTAGPCLVRLQGAGHDHRQGRGGSS